jgi:hypothetical protein
MQFPQKEMAAASVSELRKRYEKAANGDVFSEFSNWRNAQANKAMEDNAMTKIATTLKHVEVRKFIALNL